MPVTFRYFVIKVLDTSLEFMFLLNFLKCKNYLVCSVDPVYNSLYQLHGSKKFT